MKQIEKQLENCLKKVEFLKKDLMKVKASLEGDLKNASEDET